MKCPKCSGLLELLRFEHIEIDRCQDCKGIWFDAYELEALRELRGSETIDIGDRQVGRELDDKNALDCPRCEIDLVRLRDIHKTQITYEACLKCDGIWFDAGEFRNFKTDFSSLLSGLLSPKIST
jgi:uncharacterized protein